MAKRQDFTAEQQSVRVLKVGERVRHILSELLARQEVHDDVVSASNIAVTEVRMTPDLRHATAYVKPLLGAGPKIGEDDVVVALRHGSASNSRPSSNTGKTKALPKPTGSKRCCAIPKWRAIWMMDQTKVPTHSA